MAQLSGQPPHGRSALESPPPLLPHRPHSRPSTARSPRVKSTTNRPCSVTLAFHQEKTGQLRNDPPLYFVSLLPLCVSRGRLGLSRVKMNALRAPLTARAARRGMSVIFFAG